MKKIESEKDKNKKTNEDYRDKKLGGDYRDKKPSEGYRDKKSSEGSKNKKLSEGSKNKKLSEGYKDRKSNEGHRDKKPMQKSTVSGRKDSRLIYAAGGAFCLVVLVACAFFLPSLLFGLKDRYLWQDTVLEARENVDVTILSASYEPSLYNRMLRFAEGLAAGTEYYVSEQDLDVNEELYELLQGEDGLFQAPLRILVENQFLSAVLFDLYFDHLTVESWKQYVIYSDDYAQGVNFIMWYLEIAASTGKKLEVLVDAETMTLYGMKSERNNLMTQTQLDRRWGGLRDSTLYGYISRSAYELPDLWNMFSYYYEALSQEELWEYYYQLERYGYVYTDNEFDTAVTESIVNSRIRISADGNKIVLQIFYGEQYLDFAMELIPDPESNDYYYPQLTVGIDAICRLIPEFSESF